MMTIRGIPEDVHRALRVRAKSNGRSTEAEVREILRVVAKPPERIRLGDLLDSISKDAGSLTEEEVVIFETIRDKTPIEPMRFE